MIGCWAKVHNNVQTLLGLARILQQMYTVKRNNSKYHNNNKNGIVQSQNPRQVLKPPASVSYL